MSKDKSQDNLSVQDFLDRFDNRNWLFVLCPVAIIFVLTVCLCFIPRIGKDSDLKDRLEQVQKDLGEYQNVIDKLRETALVVPQDTGIVVGKGKSKQDISLVQYYVDSASVKRINELQSELSHLSKEVLKKDEVVKEYVDFLNSQIAMWLSIIAAICTILPVVLAIVQRREMKEELERFLLGAKSDVADMISTEDRAIQTKVKEKIDASIDSYKENIENQITEISNQIRELKPKAEDIEKSVNKIESLEKEIKDKETEINGIVETLDNQKTTLDELKGSRNLLSVQSLMSSLFIFRDFDNRESTFKSRLPLVKELTKYVIETLRKYPTEKDVASQSVEIIQLYQATKQVLHHYKACFTQRNEIVETNNSLWQIKRTLDSILPEDSRAEMQKEKIEKATSTLIEIYEVFLKNLETIKG